MLEELLQVVSKSKLHIPNLNLRFLLVLLFTHYSYNLFQSLSLVLGVAAELSQAGQDHGLFDPGTLPEEELEPSEADDLNEVAPLRIVTCYFLI